jgi:hypothetical protein
MEFRLAFNIMTRDTMRTVALLQQALCDIRHVDFG